LPAEPRDALAVLGVCFLLCLGSCLASHERNCRVRFRNHLLRR
jgi:hypothetical protein